jgi:hypothetical protein
MLAEATHGAPFRPRWQSGKSLSWRTGNARHRPCVRIFTLTSQDCCAGTTGSGRPISLALHSRCRDGCACAVAGVVNFILKDDFNGTTIRSSFGDADDSDFGRRSFAITTGRNFDQGRGNAIFSIGYDEQDLLAAGERGGDYLRLFGTVPNPANGDTIDGNGIQVDDGVPDRITVPNQGLWAVSTGGTFIELGGNLAPDGSFVPFDNFEFTEGLNCGGTGCPALDLDSFQVLQSEFERLTLDANFTYDLTDDLEWFFEGRYANVDGAQQGQPSFDLALAGSIPIARDNAFVSPSLGAAMDAAGLSVAGMNRFNVDLGLRQEENNRETFRAVSGLRGDFADDYTYEVFANYGRTTVERVNLNNDRRRKRSTASKSAGFC